MRSNLHNLALRVAIAPPTAAVNDNTPIVGNWIDRTGHESLTFGILTGTLADADATFAILIEDANADDKSDAAAVPDDGLVSAVDGIAPETAAAFTFAADNVTRKVGYVGDKKFVRLTVTPNGNADNAPIAAMAIMANAHHRPTA